MEAHFPPVRCRDLSPVSRRQQENLKLYSSVEGCPVLASTLIYSGFLSGTKCKNAISISGKLGFLVELSPPPSRTCVCRNLRDFENQGTAPTVSRQLLPTITSGQRHIQLPTRRVLKHGTRRNAHLWVLGTRPFASIIGTLFFFLSPTRDSKTGFLCRRVSCIGGHAYIFLLSAGNEVQKCYLYIRVESDFLVELSPHPLGHA